jgi:putative peptidoglycan lipid II flippase
MPQKNRSKTPRKLFFSIASTTASRGIGFLRSIVETSLLGLSAATDSYQAAFRLTNFFREVFAEGALGGVFTPLHSEAEAQESSSQGWSFFWLTSLTVLLLSSLLVLGLYLGLDSILKLWLIDFSPPKLASTAIYAKWMLPYLVLISTASMFMILHHIQGRFVISSLHPTLFSVSIIGCGLFDPLQELGQSLSLGILIGGFFQLLILAFTLKPKAPNWQGMKSQIPRLRRLLVMLFPVLFALGVQRINRLVDLQFASGLIEGSLSSLAYALVVINVPMGLISIASSNVFYPLITKFKAEKKQKSYQVQVLQALRFLLVLAIPMALFFTVHSYAIIDLLFHKIPLWMGMNTLITPMSVELMAGALTYYSPGLVCFIVNPLLIKIFHSSLNTRTPALLGIILVAVNIVLNILLTPLFAVKGIALASSVTAFLQTALLIWKLRQGGHFQINLQIFWDSLRFLFAAMVAIGVGTLSPMIISPIPEFFLGICVYFFLLFTVKYFRSEQGLI